MREDDLWRYAQHSRRLREYILDLGVVWNDTAARDISTRYLQPQEEDAEQLNRHLAELKQTLATANEQMTYIHGEAPEATRLAEQIAKHTEEIRAEEKTAHEHIELSAKARAQAATLFDAVQHLIQQANACCADVGGGSAGGTITRVTHEAEQINSGSRVSRETASKPTSPKTAVAEKTVAIAEAASSHIVQPLAISENKTVLKPNHTYSDNGYTFETNSHGQVAGIRGSLVLKKAPRDKKLQGEVGKSGISGDHGGHYIGARFNGPSELYNLFPQNSNLNQSQWWTMENKWAKLLEEGYQIDVDIRPAYINDTDRRPFGVEVYYNVSKRGHVDRKSRLFYNEEHGEDLGWRERNG